MSSAPKNVNQKLSPVELARETIKQMALKRVEPNPENYLVIYNELAGVPAKATLTQAIQKSLKALPRDTPMQMNWVNRWEKCSNSKAGMNCPL